MFLAFIGSLLVIVALGCGGAVYHLHLHEQAIHACYQRQKLRCAVDGVMRYGRALVDLQQEITQDFLIKMSNIKIVVPETSQIHVTLSLSWVKENCVQIVATGQDHQKNLYNDKMLMSVADKKSRK
jgi:hypothetical protein